MGLGLFSSVRTKLAPIMPNCRRCSGKLSTLAPRSSICTWPFARGSALTIAGRSIPGSVFSTNRAVAMRAPVLPALTHASAFPAFTRSIDIRREESFLFLSAETADSSIPTTSVDLTISSLGCDFSGPNAFSIESIAPTSFIERSGLSCTIAQAAGTVTGMPISPPIASTARVVATSVTIPHFCLNYTRIARVECSDLNATQFRPGR